MAKGAKKCQRIGTPSEGNIPNLSIDTYVHTRPVSEVEMYDWVSAELRVRAKEEEDEEDDEQERRSGCVLALVSPHTLTLSLSQ